MQMCGKLQPCIEHHLDVDRKLFFMFDCLHLLKCIRNNWLGQLESNHTFLCPGMANEGICAASFAYVRDLYNSEKDSLVKLASTLTNKTLYPNSLERQNVKLALKMFDEKTAVALVHYGNQNQIDMNGAHQLIYLIMF